MPRCALVNAGNAVLAVETNANPAAQTRAGFRWLPCPAVAKPSFDAATETVDGPTYTVNANDVTEVWTKRSRTAPEMAEAKAAAVNGINGPLKPVLKILLNHENRIRAGATPPQPALSMADFKTFFEGLL